MISSLLQKAGLRPGLALHSAIPKVLMAAAILGGSGSLLSAGSAIAQSTCSFGSNISFTACSATTLTEGDKTVTFTNLLGLNPSATYGGTITLADLGFNFYSVSTVFIGPLGAGEPANTIGYDIEIDPLSNNYFSGVKLTANSDISASTVIKTEVSAPSLFTQLTVSGTGSNPPGMGTFNSIPGFAKKLSILDTFSTPTPGALTSYVNTFRQSEAPGPLPVLGAGMAFGFSRKLRSRIKASAKAKA